MTTVHSTNDSFLQWDPAQVCSYINSVMTEGDQKLGLAFLDNNIEGSLLPFITTEHLKEIGIHKLSTRLQIKKNISDLINKHYEKSPPKSFHDPEYKLSNINLNNNFIHFESLTLSTVLMKEMMKKLSVAVHQSLTSSPTSDQQTLDIKRLHDNFNRLKSDLIPIIRLLKDSKPLPTPTLDPGHSTNYVDSPTYSISSNHSTNSNTLIDTLQDAGLINQQPGSNRNSNPNPLPSPTQSNRFSSGSILSLGTGKMISSQNSSSNIGTGGGGVGGSVGGPGVGSGSGPSGNGPGGPGGPGGPSTTSNSSNSLTNNPNDKNARPRLVESKSSSSAYSVGGSSKPFRKHSSLASSNTLGQDNSNSAMTSTSSSAASTASTIGPGSNNAVNTSNEPLKQLRASSEDSCLKILQQAMKRHHIPRVDWSKYVLVICYGDKERILKLAEKPVPIFKELQELGKHPAIMLRQLADTIEQNNDINELYEDSRIGDDIPGGTL